MSLFPFDVQRPLIDLSCLPNLERLERKSDSSRIRASVEAVLDENDDPTAVYCARLVEFRVQTPITPLSTTCAFSPRMGPRTHQVSNAILASPSLSSRGETPVLIDFLDPEQVSLQVASDADGIGQKPQVARRLERKRIRAREEDPFTQDSNLSPVRKARKIAEKRLAALQSTYDTDESRETDGSESECEGNDIESEYEKKFNGSRLNQSRLTVGGQLTRFKWTELIKDCFNQAFNDLQESQRTSKNILEKMREISPELCGGLSIERVKSHLQKYRIKNHFDSVRMMRLRIHKAHSAQS